MKRVKRLLAVVLTLMMLVGCATTVYALDDFESSSKRSPVQEKAAKTLESGAFDLSRIGELSRDNCRITSLEPSDEKVFVDLIHFFSQEPKKKIVHIFRLDTIGEVTFDLSSIDIKKSESYTAYYLMRSGEWGTKGIKVTGTKNGVLSIRSSVSGPVIIAKNEKGAVTAKPKSVKVSPAKYTLDVEKKKSVQLTATVSPEGADRTITWTPSNKNVVTVDKNGLVTAVGRGTSTVTATTSNKKKATCRITVTEPKKPSSVKINRVSKPIKNGQTIYLSAQIMPKSGIMNKYKVLSWSLAKNNKGHATINPKTGELKCTGTGDIKVQVKTVNNKEGTITIKGPKAVKSVKVKPASSKVKTGNLKVGDSFSMKSTVSPKEAIDSSVTWNSSDESVATVDQKGKVTCLKPGKATITATSKSNKNKSGKCNLTVKTSAVKKKYVIATDTSFAPFEYKDASGKLRGIDIELMEVIAKNQGFKIEFKALGFDGSLQALEKGQVDGVIAGLSVTEKRKEKFHFSENYYNVNVSMAVKPDANIKSLDDIKGKKVAVKNGTTGALFASNIKSSYNLKIVEYRDTLTMLNAVVRGDVDACFEDYPILAYAIKTNKNLNLKKVESVKEFETPYAFAVKKGKNQELIKMFNSGLASVKRSGEYDRIINRYI